MTCYVIITVSTAVKPLVYLLLIMASTEPQKLLFRAVPGVTRCHSLFTTTNFHVGKKIKKVSLQEQANKGGLALPEQTSPIF